MLRSDCCRDAAISVVINAFSDGSITLRPYSKGCHIYQLSPNLPTNRSLIFDISSFTIRRISRTNASDCCCDPRSHMPTYNDSTQLLSRIVIWDRGFSSLIISKDCVGHGTIIDPTKIFKNSVRRPF